MRTRSAASVLLLLGSGLLGASASAQYAVCEHNTWWGADEYVGGHRRMTPASFEFAGFSAPFDRAWRSWWELDTSNPAVWADWTDLSPCAWYGEDGDNCLRNMLSTTLSGQEQSWHPVGWSSNIIETDVLVSSANPLQNTGSSIPSMPGWLSGCAVPIGTQEVTYIHELGHSYGHGHFDDWLSTMNDSPIDVTTCEPLPGGVWRARPAPEAVRCHEETYGIAAAYDVGGTPLRKVCPIPNGTQCIQPFLADSIISRTASSMWGWVEYTAMNLREALPDYVAVTVYASSDARLTPDDAPVFTGQWDDPAEAETRKLTHGFTFDPRVAMPLVGTRYCFLVQLNSDGYFAETNPNDDVLDTLTCYTRL